MTKYQILYLLVIASNCVIGVLLAKDHGFLFLILNLSLLGFFLWNVNRKKVELQGSKDEHDIPESQ